MNDFDVGVIIVGLLAALGGWRIGFLSRVASWVGLALGLYLAVRYLPNILNSLDLTGKTALAVAVVILLAAAFAGQGIGFALGSKLHAVLPFGGARTLDRAVGAASGVVGVLAAVWLLAPAIAAVPGWPSQLVTRSVIARWVTNETRDLGVNPPNTLDALGRLVGGDGFPQVFLQFGPSKDVGNPPGQDPVPTGQLATAAASTVKVYGQACGLLQEGSGWAVAPNLVVTNAHVVAGEPAGDTDVLLPDGNVKPATVVVYNPNVDLALLSVPGLGERSLALATGYAGEKGAVLGHPNGQDPLAAQPAEIADWVHAEGKNLYGTLTTYRYIYVLAARLAKGDSGAPLVDSHGQVLGIAFAIAPDRATTAYALAVSELRPLLQGPHTQAVSTQGCLDD
ncbi:MAG TPA: MarP family serine protease [Acidimicrobiales bacterium]|nr:MarP family serine protease [Acidimicrobiales bacterium]